MRRTRYSLRARLAVLGFLAIYLPVLVLFTVATTTQYETTEVRSADVVSAESSAGPLSWATWTVIALGPVAAGLAWLWAGRAVRPIERVRAVAEEIGAADLSRRISLDHGPTEIVLLAASFDAMLDRLEDAAATQRRLIEETSHELRTPLSLLSANADVLLAHPEPTLDVYRRGLERSRSAAVRLQATIAELLVDARGRARTIDRHPGDLMAIAQAVVGDARPLAERTGVGLSISGPETVPCRLDEPTVTRALANLVDNAIRHGGGAVEVRVEGSRAEASVVVTDHGRGIPPAELDHVFERFWHGRAGGGTGLGLPIARQIALAHGGDVVAKSPGPAGDGCAFRLTLRR